MMLGSPACAGAGGGGGGGGVGGGVGLVRAACGRVMAPARDV